MSFIKPGFNKKAVFLDSLFINILHTDFYLRDIDNDQGKIVIESS